MEELLWCPERRERALKAAKEKVPQVVAQQN